MPIGDTPDTLGEIIARAFATAHGKSHDGTVTPGDNNSMYITDMHPLIPPSAPAVSIHDGPAIVNSGPQRPLSTT